jgi:hypothetical protein
MVKEADSHPKGDCSPPRLRADGQAGRLDPAEKEAAAMGIDPHPRCPGHRGVQMLIRTVLRKRLRKSPDIRRVWDVVCRWGQGDSHEQIVRMVSRAYGVSSDTVRRDIVRIVAAVPGFCFAAPTDMIEQARAEARKRRSVELCAGALVLMLIVRERLRLDAATARVGSVFGLSFKSIEAGFWDVMGLL